VPENHHDDDKTQTHIPLLKDTTVGHYRIVEKIGAGGMGEVYLAEDTELDRKVALKFLPPHLCHDEDCRKRFMREARAIAKISHPNIITIYEVAEFNGRPYLSIELIEGPSLKVKIKGDKLDLKYVLNLAIQIGEALSEIHHSGVVHRDIKPSNILIDRKGTAHLADFGLVHVDNATELTRPGSRMGTIGYMSPEQVKGETIDGGSDIFSLGIVLYEALTGHQPFRKNSEAASLEAILNIEPDSISNFRPDVPQGFQRIIERMIAKSKLDRFQNVDDLLVELKKQGNALDLGTEPDELRIRDVVDNNVLIMQFRNMIDPCDKERQGEIITNLLITGLSESGDLHVVSSQRVFDIIKLLGKTDNLTTDPTLATQIARKARANWMILGDLLQLKPTIMVTSQIVDTKTGQIISAQRLSSYQDEDIFLFTDRLMNQLYAKLPSSKTGSNRLDRSVTEVTTNSQEAYRYYLEGMEHFYKYLETEADKCFELAIKHDPAFAMAYYRRARRPIGTNKEEMIKKAVKYSARASRKERLYINAMDARIEGDYERSASELEKIISNYSNEKEALLLLGNLYRLATGDVEKGIHYYEEVLELDPNHAEAYLNLTYAYHTMGKYYLSLQAANKLVELAPDNPNSFDSLGDIYSWNGEIDQGLEAFLKAVEIDGRFLHAIWKAGVLYTFKQHFKQAEELFRRLASCDDIEYRAGGRLSLGLLPYYRGRFQEAIGTLDTGLASDEMEDYKGYFRAYKHLLKGKILLVRKDYLKGIDEIKLSIGQFRDIDPAISYPSVILCKALGTSGDEHNAQKVLHEISTNLKKHRRRRKSVYHVAAGFLDFTQRRYDSAERNLLEASKDPLIWEWEGANRFELFTLLGQTYVKKQSFEKAVEILESTRKEFSVGRLMVATSSAEIYYFLGIAYEKSGWKEKAINNFKTFLNIWKDADSGIDEIEDAKKRLAYLKSAS